MTGNDNSVNIKNAKRTYHHGDLRAALIAEGLSLLATGDVNQLSLRAIARNAGVSATAVYRHFPDKNALLTALCVEGDSMLSAAQRAAQGAAGRGREGLDASGRAYVRFALANPALFRLMMSRFSSLYGETLETRNSDGLRLLLDNVASVLSKDAADEEKRIVALQSWAIVHGLSMMMLDGILPHDEAIIDSIITTPFLHARK